LKFKQDRLAKIKAAKKALDEREEQLNPGKDIDDKKQISFAATKARIMGKKAALTTPIMPKSVLMLICKLLWHSMSVKALTTNRNLNKS
jgi:hypothetical protein